ncbi:MAG TPA: DNA repair protein RecN [Candidatus Limnocylindrales bacterium]|nr:DNA repair protein RecN [Candidatus Limnocylindrales bacterium]
MTADRAEARDPEMAASAPDRAELAKVGRLLELTVTDLALIDRLRLAFDAGLNVITGETGAGKSLLIDALGLAIGARADTTLVRHGAETAVVEALFDRLPEPLIAVREVTANGRSTARLDDGTVTAARLADEIGPLVEVHGQHDQGRLLDERWQRDLLDGFGGHESLRAAMATAVDRWRENRAALDAAALDPREVARRLDLLTHEATEIAGAGLRPGEADEIRARLTAAQHGEAIARGAATLREALTAEGQGARDATAVALHEARALARLDPRFEPLADRLAGLEAEVADVADEARRLADSIDHDPRAVAELDARLGVIHGLLRRYGDDEQAVLDHGDRAAAEADRLRGLDAERERRQSDDARLLAAVATAAAALSTARRSTASSLTRAVTAVLEELGFPPGVFEVAVGPRPATGGEAAVEVDGDAVAFDASGIDHVVYRLAPNPGEPARPLARIASGGELSRVALAVKRVLAEADATPTLVFDEVDTGIGGRSADPVGRSLWGLARRHQVLCVTHLPQIAAHADAHYRIAKRERDGRTVTEVERLDREGRIVELAAMLGGGPGDPAALASARELLDRAEARRSDAVGAVGGDRPA